MKTQSWLRPLVVVTGGLALWMTAVSAAENVLTEEEKKEGYRLLFNGADFTGWHRTAEGYGGWQIVDGALCRAGGGRGCSTAMSSSETSC